MVLYLPLLTQGLIMAVDEFYFHRKRRLGLWETLGHPLDTLSVLACYVFISSQPWNEQNLWIYIGLAVFSSLFVTKDEFIHTQHCCSRENWLHALLFVLHPICFFAAGFLWWTDPTTPFLKIQTGLIFFFMVYQIMYWGLAWKKRPL